MFFAQCLSLIGSGLATVALGLLAYELAGDNAGMVLGIAMAIKMVSYVFISPIAAALASNMQRRNFMVGLDLARAALVLFFPFVDQIWQVYLLIFLLFSLTAGFTPVFQATIPDIIKDEGTYVDALTLSRVSFNIEAIASPILAGIFITVMTFNWLFVFTSLGFLASAALVWQIKTLAAATTANPAPFIKRVTTGLVIFQKTPRLRGLMALNVVVSLMAANVYINSIIVAHKTLAGNETNLFEFATVFRCGIDYCGTCVAPADQAADGSYSVPWRGLYCGALPDFTHAQSGCNHALSGLGAAGTGDILDHHQQWFVAARFGQWTGSPVGFCCPVFIITRLFFGDIFAGGVAGPRNWRSAYAVANRWSVVDICAYCGAGLDADRQSAVAAHPP